VHSTGHTWAGAPVTGGNSMRAGSGALEVGMSCTVNGRCMRLPWSEHALRCEDENRLISCTSYPLLTAAFQRELGNAENDDRYLWCTPATT